MTIWSNNINTSSTTTLAQSLTYFYSVINQVCYHYPYLIGWWFFFSPNKNTMHLEGAEGNLGFGFGFACFPAYYQETNYSKIGSEIGLLSDNAAYRKQKYSEHNLNQDGPAGKGRLLIFWFLIRSLLLSLVPKCDHKQTEQQKLNQKWCKPTVRKESDRSGSCIHIHSNPESGPTLQTQM